MNKNLSLALFLLAGCGARDPDFQIGPQGIVQSGAILPLPREVDVPNKPIYTVTSGRPETLIELNCTLSPAARSLVSVDLIQEAADGTSLPSFGSCDIWPGGGGCGATTTYRTAWPGSRIYARLSTASRRSARVDSLVCGFSVQRL
jgi:hypothetical protein